MPELNIAVAVIVSVVFAPVYAIGVYVPFFIWSKVIYCS